MSQILRVAPNELPPPAAAGLRDGAIVATAPVAVLELVGAGAVAAFQGLLTNDIEKPGDGAFLYGALLTPKGMVVVEGWTGRSATRVTYTVPAVAGDRALELLTRYIPPRLARSSDRTSGLGVLRLAGPRALAIAQSAGVPLPTAPGRLLTATVAGVALEVAQPGEAGPPPFALQLTAPRAALDDLAHRLVAAGARAAAAPALELARILAGWPSVAADVDEKTLPQEVRFDEIAGVSYTKGCYTGQETVSRLHFRGHANRSLRGLVFDTEPALNEDALVQYRDRDAGRVTSMAWLAHAPGVAGRWIGLAVLRREVTPGAVVRAGGTDARVVDLPFAPAYLVPA
jgi:folate-binding protein YgfZ